MKVCEFLLQKEGDRAWLPLDTPTVEILEGRYRIVARTRQPETEVLVEVSYWSPEEMPPKRRTRHWNRQTNAKGIMPVLTYTRLRSGNWRIQCSSDLLKDMGDQGWQQAVELRVLAQEELEDWGEPTPRMMEVDSRSSDAVMRDLVPEDTPPQPRKASVEELRALAEQMSQFVVDTVLEAASIADTVDSPSTSMTPSSIATPPTPASLANAEAEAADFFDVPDIPQINTPVSSILVPDIPTTNISTTDTPSISTPVPDISPIAVTPSAEVPAKVSVEVSTLSLPEDVADQVDASPFADLHSSSESLENLGTVALDTGADLSEADLHTASAETVRPELVSSGIENSLPPSIAIGSNAGIETPIVPTPSDLPSIAHIKELVGIIPAGIQLQLQNSTIVPSAYSIFEIRGFVLQANGDPWSHCSLPLQVRVTLKNPSNMEVRLAMTQLLSTQPIDQPFYISGHIALDWKNQLLLGEVQLQVFSPSQEDLTEAMITIASTGFTIMPPVDALLTHVAPMPEAAPQPVQPRPITPAEEPPRKHKISTDFLEVTRRSLSFLNPSSLVPKVNSASTALPPKVNRRPSSDPKTPKTPHLPSFVKTPPAPVSEEPETMPLDPLPTSQQPLYESATEGNSSDRNVNHPQSVDPTALNQAQNQATAPVDFVVDPFATEDPASIAPDSLASHSMVQSLTETLETLVDDLVDSAMPEQLALLDLEEWTDPSVVPPESQPSKARKVIELPPIPSKVSSSLVNTLGLEAIVAETIADAVDFPPAIELESAGSNVENMGSVESSERVDFEITPDRLEMPAIGVTDPSFSVDPALNAPNTSAEAVNPSVTDSSSLNTNLNTHLDPDLAAELEAENEILLSLYLDPLEHEPPEPDRFPSRLTNVLNAEQSLQLRSNAPETQLQSTPVQPAAVEFPHVELPQVESSQVELANTALPTVELGTLEDPAILDDVEIPPSLTLGAEPLEDEFTWDEEPIAAWDSVESPSLTSSSPLIDTATPQEAKLEVGEFFGSYDPSPVTSHSGSTDLDSFFSESATAFPDTGTAEDATSSLDSGDRDALWTDEAKGQPFVLDHLRWEVVVEDEWLEPNARHWMSLTPAETVVPWPAEEPLPVPSVELPVGDLVGGKTLRVTLRLPDSSSRFVVKLWVIDCQSRSLAAGPYWAYQFLPTLPEFREAIVELEIPLGCLEVQFEALTLEPDTQRESHKYTLVKAIVPPDLSDVVPALPEDSFLEYLPAELSLETLEDLETPPFED